MMAAVYAFAINAPKTSIQYKQPDGSVVTLVQHGDEFHHWTTMNGVVVKQDAEGFWRPVANQIGAKAESLQSKMMRMEAAELSRAVRGSAITQGEKPFLVILVEFNDLAFTVPNPQQAFTDLLNQEGYSANGGTGSARDYYVQNSSAAFKPTFEIKGPVKVSQSYKYYGANDSNDNDKNPREAFYEACSLLDASVDFSRYDNDKDGYVDNVFFYYAGHNEAENAGADFIWPHASSLGSYNARFDGVRVYRYACSSELKGTVANTTMCGISTFCHEFGHVLGLPDFYDTDYSKNGSARNMGNFSLMANGSYNNSGRTPPRLGALERNLLGWMDGYTALTGGNVTLPAIQNNVAYKLDADVDGEYFIIETRDATSWDKFIPGGLLIYHVDRSSNQTPGGRASSLWNSNTINAYSAHPCCFPVASTNYGSDGNVVYPGNGNVTTFSAVAWSGKEMATFIRNIAYSGGVSTFTVDDSRTLNIFGTVLDVDGNPLKGVSVTAAVAPAAVGQSSAGKMRTSSVSRSEAGNYQAVTAEDGSYTINLDNSEAGKTFNVTASLSGYVDKTLKISLSGYDNRCDFRMRLVGTIEDYYLTKFDPSSARVNGLGTGTSASSLMGGVRYTAAEISAYAGMKITELKLCTYTTAAKNLYVLVDFGSSRVLAKKVENPEYGKWITVDVSDDNLVIPSGKDVVFGYAVDTPSGDNAYYCLGVIPMSSGTLLYANYNLSSVNWSEYAGQTLAMGARVLGDQDPGTDEVTLAIMGYNSISDPKEGKYKAGDNFELKILEVSANKPSSVEWYWDGTKQSAASVPVTAGKHTVKAVLTYPANIVEEITLEITAD